MRKVLLSLIIVFTALGMGNTILAESTPTPDEVIFDEETPEAAAKKNNNLLLYTSLGFVMVLAVGVVIVRNNQFQLFVENVKTNDDGSYTVTWGYKNPFFAKKKIKPEETGFNVSKGSIIVLKQMENDEFKSGVHKSAVVTVINDETEMEWYAGKYRATINREVIEKKRKVK